MNTRSFRITLRPFGPSFHSRTIRQFPESNGPARPAAAGPPCVRVGWSAPGVGWRCSRQGARRQERRSDGRRRRRTVVRATDSLGAGCLQHGRAPPGDSGESRGPAAEHPSPSPSHDMMIMITVSHWQWAAGPGAAACRCQCRSPLADGRLRPTSPGRLPPRGGVAQPARGA
jgi:hypothetical protein